jgi:undecaprenyl-diphosphatase
VGYGLVVGIYVLFELVIINYRPVLVEGELEASYPSSHTLMSTFILLSTAYLINHLFKDSHKVIKNILIIICYILCALMVVFRLLAGVHWLSDIIGGLFISLCLYFAYVGFIEII